MIKDLEVGDPPGLPTLGLNAAARVFMRGRRKDIDSTQCGGGRTQCGGGAHSVGGAHTVWGGSPLRLSATLLDWGRRKGL